MNYQADQQFVTKLNKLIKEILTDESLYLSGKDNSLSFLHEKVFSKVTSTSFDSLEEPIKLKFRKYFYLSDNTTPRTDVPFGNSSQSQAFFIDQFRSQVRCVTMGLNRFDFVRPLIQDDGTAKFQPEQEQLIRGGLLHPFIHCLEQKEIAEIEAKKAAGKQALNSENPFAGLGNQILVMGESGQFDTVLNLNQIEDIIGQEGIYRTQGLPDSAIQKLISEYIKSRYPDLKLKLDAKGNPITFTNRLGFTAENALNQSVPQGLSFKQLQIELLARQAKSVQYQTIIASKGNLSFSPLTFQVISGDGNPVSLHGFSIGIDKTGKNQNGTFFLVDQKGSLARFTFDLAENRLKGQSDIKVSIYDQAEHDSPLSPKMTIPGSSLDKFQKPLRDLYQEYQETGDYSPTSIKPTLKKPLSAGKPVLLSGASFQPGSANQLPTEIPFEQEFKLAVPKPLSVGFKPKTKEPTLDDQYSIKPGTKLIEKKVMPKIPAGKGFEAAKKAVQQPKGEPLATGHQTANQKKSADLQTPSVKGTKDKTMSKAWIAIGSTILPIAGSLAAGASAIFNFK
ncbi:hypothetical protein IT412_01095 [Candidatus Peregrinibacteria bacterium]|nr:hypothetical protein [Candidatus Peregrinibacteria bacterium]